MIQRGDTLKEQAYFQLRQKILHQELAMGERLNIAALTREFQISNSPLREAISLLENDGLVESMPNAGFRIACLNQDMMDRLTQTLLVLLDGCYLDCMRKKRLPLLARRLGETLAQQKAAYTGVASYDYACLAIAFDRCFVDVCENPMLSSMFVSKFDLLMIETLYVYQKDPHGVEQNLREHELLCKAVEEGQHQQVRSLLEKHYDKSYLTFD